MNRRNLAHIFKVIRITVLVFLLAVAIVLYTIVPGTQALASTLLSSFLQVAVVVLLLLIAFRWWQQQRNIVRIYPFQNLTGDKDNQEKFDALAETFADLLYLETQRINNLLSSEDLVPRIATRESGEKKVATRFVVTSVGRTSSTSTPGADQYGEPLESVSALLLGTVNLPLGNLLVQLVRTIQGGGITGSFQKHADSLSIVATSAKGKWEVVAPDFPSVSGQDEKVIRDLARQLAYKIRSDDPAIAAADWHSFSLLIDGIEQLQQYLLSYDTHFLDEARDYLEQATIADRQFVYAHYTLGRIYEQYGALETAIGLYKLAIQLRRDFNVAYLSLGMAYAQRTTSIEDTLEEARRICERGLEIASETRQPLPEMRGTLAYWYGQSAAQKHRSAAQLMDQDRLQARQLLVEAYADCQRSFRAYRTALREYDRLIRRVRRAQDNADQRVSGWRKKQQEVWVALADALKLRAQIIEVLENQFHEDRMTKLRRSTSDSFRRVGAVLGGMSPVQVYQRAYSRLNGVENAYRGVEKALKTNLQMDVRSSAGYAELGRFYSQERRRYDLALPNLLRAREIDPENIDVTGAMADFSYNLVRPDIEAIIDRVFNDETIKPEEQPNLRVILRFLDLARSFYETRLTLELKQRERLESNSLLNLAFTIAAEAALNALIDHGEAFLENLRYARALIGKALALNPVVAEIYGGLRQLYVLEAKLRVLSAVETSAEIRAALDELARGYSEIQDRIAKDAGNVLFNLSQRVAKPGEQKAQDAPRNADEQARELAGHVENKLTLADQLNSWVLGWLFIQGGSREQGLEYLEAAQAPGPLNEADLTYYEIGMICIELQRWDPAADYFQKVDAQDFRYLHSRIALAEALGTKATSGSTVSKQEQTRRTEAYQTAYDQALNKIEDPYLLARVYAGRADFCRLQKRYTDAIRDCHSALHLAPAYSYGRAVLASTYLDMSDYDRAIHSWEQAVALASDTAYLPDYHRQLAQTQYLKSNTVTDDRDRVKLREQSIGEYTTAIGLFDDGRLDEIAGTAYELAGALIENHQYKEAAAACRQAVALGQELPQAYDFHLRLAYIYTKLKWIEDAASEYQEAIQLRETSLALAQGSGDKDRASRSAGELAVAYNDLAYYIHAENSVNPKEGLVLVERALKLLELHTEDKDSRDYKSSNGAFLDTRGWLHYKLGDIVTAEQDISEAIELTFGTVFEHVHLAIIYERKGELAQADSERLDWQRKARAHWQFALDMDGEGELTKEAQARLEHLPA